MELAIYQVDAFASRLFSGNPAAVVPLKDWLDEELMQRIAAENNLSETAFVLGSAGRYHIRWFTPRKEVWLCGHATLAAAYVLFEQLGETAPRLVFSSKGGELSVEREQGLLVLTLAAEEPAPGLIEDDAIAALACKPREIWRAAYHLLVYDSELEVRRMAPDFAALGKSTETPVIVTAPGQQVDFVSRFFAPAYGIDEDPVTGSAHASLVPYWARRLGRQRLRARQISPRGGEIDCELASAGVRLAGSCSLYLKGTIYVG